MRIVWSPSAMRDRVAIYDYIDADSPNAAADLDDRIMQRIAGLLDFPNSGRSGRVEGTRELVVKATPYVVVHGVNDDTIRILRILHGAQRWPDDADP